MKKHIGSDFDTFLEKEGLLTEVETAALKRVIAYQVEELMQRQRLTKTSFGRWFFRRLKP